MSESSEKFSDLPPAPPINAIQREVADGMDASAAAAIYGDAWWNRGWLEYSDFAQDEMIQAAEAGLVTKDRFMDMCGIIGTESIASNIDDLHILALQKMFDQADIKLDAQTVIENQKLKGKFSKN